MRPNIVTEAGLPTRMGQWWESIPFLTSAVVIVCGTIYLVCLLTGYDSFYEVCFLPSAVISRFQVYRIYTSIIFHGSLLHVLFNMLALVPLGSELERIMGSIRFLYLVILLATCNAAFHLLIALVVAHNPFQTSQYLMHECAIGFSGIIFSLIIIETSLSGVQSRSVFGLFNVPAKWYAFILLMVFQLLMTNVSLLGHLCGILSGFAYTYGLFNFLIPGPSFYSAIESTSWLSSCVRRHKFIMCTGGSPTSHLPTYSTQNTSSGFSAGSMWTILSSWMRRTETSVQPVQDSRFPGRGRILASDRNPNLSSDSNLQTRLLENSTNRLDSGAVGRREPLSDGRRPVVDNVAPAVPEGPTQHQNIGSNEKIQKLVSMGFEKTQVEVALAAADGDLNLAAEILMSQQG